MKPIGIFYEHPTWFKPLFDELDRRGIVFVPIHAESHQYDPSEKESPFSLVVNRMSSSAHLRDHVNAYFHTLNYIYHFEKLGVPVINGMAAQLIESSKARQLALFSSLGLNYPKSKVVNHIDQVIPAAKSLHFPIVIKANIGGSGAGIVRFDTLAGLTKAIEQNQINLGIDHTALVQEFLTARGQHIVRVETLNHKYLYAIKVHTTGESFNLCPAELCQVPDPNDALACLTDAPKKGIKVESYTPPKEVIQAVERIAAVADLDIAGVEYLVNDADGQIYFYDINALSNFVADARNVVGFNPYANFVDYIQERLSLIEQETEIAAI
ncbi:hypothetical protein WSM22_39050 [Cytophagales bacterium WSM2-2]|nr:hypothetical protein WSM22_39050 [Cytophagales bacterium WSM2-2]